MCVKYLIIFLCFICFIKFGSCETEDIHWVQPDAWSRENFAVDTWSANSKSCCPCIKETEQNHAIKTEIVKQNADNVANFVYFKKLITLLFHRNHLDYDSGSNSFQRLIKLSIPAHKLEKLEQMQDPRDLDCLLTEILQNSHRSNLRNTHNFSNVMHSFQIVSFNIYNYLLKLLNSSEIRFLLLFAFCVASGWILKQRWHISGFSFTFISIILYGYLHTYLDCNRELEYNETLRELENREEELVQKSFLRTYILSWFWDYNRPNKFDMLKSSKIALPYCRPDHVFILYINDVILKFADNLLQQGTTTLKILINLLPFPYNLIAAPLLIGLLCYILKLVFKYVVHPSILHKTKGGTEKAPSNATNPLAISDCHRCNKHDSLSGENLKKMVDVLSKCVDTRVSGVENIREEINSKPAVNKTPNTVEKFRSSASDDDYSEQDVEKSNKDKTER